jgi:predicted DNA-binding protein
MRKTKDTSVRIPEELKVRIEAILPALRAYTVNGFVEESVREMLDLIDAPPNKRELPPLVKHADAVQVKRPFRQPSSAAPVPSSPTLSAAAAEFQEPEDPSR